jgi:O-antigen ligase
MQVQIQQIMRSNKIILISGVLLFFICIALFASTGNFIFLGIPFILPIIGWLFLDWKSFYWFFIFSIPLSCEISLGSLSTTVPDEQMMWMFVPLVFLVLAANYKRLPAWFLHHPLTLIILVQFIWIIVAVIFSQNHFLSAKFLAAKSWFLISYLVMPALIIKDKRDIRRVFLLFAIPTMVHAVFAFTWHYFLHFGYWESNIVVHPFYFNHVDHSTVLSMMFPLMLVAYQLSKGKKRQRKLTLALVIFLIPAIYVTGARAAMLGLIFSFVINFAIRKRFVSLILPAFFVFIASMVFYLSHDSTFVKYRPVMKYTATQPTFGDLMTATFKGRDMSSMERFYRWIAVARMSQDHPIIGVGPNNFYDHYKAYTSPMFKTWVSRNPEKSTTHNYFMYLLVEQGWPATILYAILMMTIFRYAQKIYHRTKDNFYKKATMGIAMMLAAGFINNFFSELWETHKVGSLLFLGIVFLMLLDHLSKQEDELALANEGAMN